ncbi:glycosyltransferase family 2 protein [Rhodovulum kholense]|uniref:Glycosyl transferase family 2 n=1 Tax=Rhodovulum kholense TaxID=453584 RepID=A0A8E3AP24_9RHOB|nr:glycosyltransferase family 2 protein [Rhodovulum kholense]PTW43805.1 glycosyl transferase family 2 [Rhodovulum kholense]
MGAISTYRLRLERELWKLRARRARRQLRPVADRTAQIRPGALLAFVCLRNEAVRLPYFLTYYRRLGIDHFLIVDNGSEDGAQALLRDQPDVSLWTTGASYRQAHFGIDWLNGLLSRYGHGHWALTVDVDEFLVYPHCDTRPLRALTDWLDSAGTRSFGAMLIDTYPKGPIGAARYRAGQDPFEIACWFDSGSYRFRKDPTYRNLWIQGGPRARAWFAEAPEQAPALNKIPLVRWRRPYVYTSSTHRLLPRGLNLVYDETGGEKTCGALLHAKFLDCFAARAAEEAERREHYADGREYRAYRSGLDRGAELWCEGSETYAGWRQLDLLGLISQGNWA